MTHLSLAGSNLSSLLSRMRLWYVATVLSKIMSGMRNISRQETYTSATPLALFLLPWSISTLKCGNILFTCSADCLASSTLMTIIKARVASGLVEEASSIDMSFTNTVVFPEPVGRDIPMRVVSEFLSALRQARRHDSWYGRNCMGAFVVVSSKAGVV